MHKLIGIATLAVMGQAYAYADVSGNVSLQQRIFLEDPAYASQTIGQASVAFEPKYESSVGDNGFFSFEGFGRLDQRDDERTHFDVRQAMYSHYFDKWEVRAGVGRVFWGQTESLHLVDIINQTDFVESIDAEDKLGQPMLDVRYLLDTGSISFYVLPYFRERTFSGEDGRLRGLLPIDMDNALYESDDEQSNIDFAVRWQQTMGNVELGIAYFDGTSRIPELQVNADEEGISLVPKYNLLQQASVDALYVAGSWLLKLEAIHGDNIADGTFSAAVAGFERTLVNIANTGYDLGVLMEYQYDERENDPLVFGQNDLMFGTRLVLNDFSGSEMLLGFIQDLDESSSYSAFIEASTRLKQQWRIEINAYFFSSDEPTDSIFAFRRENRVRL